MLIHLSWKCCSAIASDRLKTNLLDTFEAYPQLFLSILSEEVVEISQTINRI